MSSSNAIVLDLEGTLISNAISVFPRPDLFWFLEQCITLTPHLYIMTAVREGRARQILELLAREGSAPQWFKLTNVVMWDGPHKDLRFVPHDPIEAIWLIDDLEHYVHHAQMGQWLPITPFVSPYDEPPGVLKAMFQSLVRVMT